MLPSSTPYSLQINIVTNDVSFNAEINTDSIPCLYQALIYSVIFYIVYQFKIESDISVIQISANLVIVTVISVISLHLHSDLFLDYISVIRNQTFTICDNNDNGILQTDTSPDDALLYISPFIICCTFFSYFSY